MNNELYETPILLSGDPVLPDDMLFGFLILRQFFPDGSGYVQMRLHPDSSGCLDVVRRAMNEARWLTFTINGETTECMITEAVFADDVPAFDWMKLMVKWREALR